MVLHLDGWVFFGVMMDEIVWGFEVGHALFVRVAVFWLLLSWSLIKQVAKILYLFFGSDG